VNPSRASIVALLLALVTAAVFSGAAGADFLLYDDPSYVTDNPVVRAGLTWEGTRLALTRSNAANWHPLTWLSLMLDVELFGVRPRPFHVENVLLHAANAALLFALLRSLTGALWPALLAAALFALHPLRVESVAWVAERKDVLSGFFGILTLCAYGAYARRPGLARHLLTTLLFALGLASKPMLVTWPLLMLLLDVWPLGRLAPATPAPSRGRVVRLLLLEKAPWFLLAAAVAVVTLVAQARGGAISLGEEGPRGVRAAAAVWAYAAYLAKAAWPLGLAAHYPYRALSPVSVPVVGAALLLLVLSGAAAASARRRPWLAAGWCWYLVALLPVAGLVRIGGHAYADRYTYLPLVGPAVALSWALAAWAGASPRRRAVAASAALLATGFLAGATRSVVPHWETSAALFAQMVAAVPDNPVGLYGLGRVSEQAGRGGEAERLYRAAAASDPRYFEPRDVLARLALQHGDRDEAERQLRQAAALRPGDVKTRILLGNLLLEEGSAEEAVVHLTEAASLDPALAQTHNNLGVALAAVGRTAEAAGSFRRALAISPGLVEARKNLEALPGLSAH
jgi:tetratricopeptide (TPR) repeat protein